MLVLGIRPLRLVVLLRPSHCFWDLLREVVLLEQKVILKASA